MAFKIAISAGHGYNTAGKRSLDGSLREWTFNDGVVDKVQKLLSGYQVEVLRLDDPTGKTDVPLKTRTDKSNAWGADCYVSVHGNAGTPSANGIETFVFTTKPAGSVKLATNVQKYMIQETKRRDRGVKTDNFHEVRETKCDAILVEGGFFTNPEELALMKSASYQQNIAEGIVQGLVATYQLKPKSTPAVNKPVSKPVAPAKASVYKVIVDNKQVGAYSVEANVLEQVKKYLNTAKEIKITKN